MTSLFLWQTAYVMEQPFCVLTLGANVPFRNPKNHITIKILGSKKSKDIWGTEISIWRTDSTPNSNDFFESKKLKRGK